MSSNQFNGLKKINKNDLVSAGRFAEVVHAIISKIIIAFTYVVALSITFSVMRLFAEIVTCLPLTQLHYGVL